MNAAERVFGAAVCLAVWPVCKFIDWRYTAWLKRTGMWTD